jgi:RNA polymerase sigma-70 factor (ECF subfamily)
LQPRDFSDEEIVEELARHEEFLGVQRALKMLDIKYQEVIALRYFEAKDNAQISEILGKPEGTVKSLLSRGIEKLRGRLQPPLK